MTSLWIVLGALFSRIDVRDYDHASCTLPFTSCHSCAALFSMRYVIYAMRLPCDSHSSRFTPANVSANVDGRQLATHQGKDFSVRY
jgi:hypothetical protein